MALKKRSDFGAIKARYTAGIRAVRRGADPMLTMSYVIWPTLDVERASHGELPPSWEMLSKRDAKRRWNRDRYERRKAA